MVKNRRKNLLNLILCITHILINIACRGQESTHIHHITIDQLKENVIGKDVQFIDVRTQREYDLGHIDDAVLINILNKKSFVENVQQFDKNKPIYLYCHVGGRSGRASKLLEKLGFTKIYDFTGGWKAWLENKDQ